MDKRKRDKYLNIYSWIAIGVYIFLVVFFPGNRNLEIFGLCLLFLYFAIRLVFRYLDNKKH